MSVESDIYDALKALVSNRVFPDVAPSGTTLPYVTYQQVGGDAPTFLERAVVPKKNGSFQVNVWARTRSEAATLILAIEAALITSTAFQADPKAAPIAGYAEEPATYGYLQQFSIWSDR